MNKKVLSVCVPFVIFVFMLFVPASFFCMPGLTVLEQRVIALFFLAALCWILEPVPIFATSVLVIVLELLMLSNKGFFLFTAGHGEPGFGSLLPYQAIMATFASPIIMLFLGGFFLAIAATKYRLDLNLARTLLKPFGSRPERVMLGLMLVTAFFSMFMSNTATTAMMLSILAPVLASLPHSDPCRTAFALSIPVAANVGGIGTPIGTPPNAVALKYILDLKTITFGGWMVFAVPFVIVLLIFAWWLLRSFFPAKSPCIAVSIEGRFMKSWQAVVAYFTFGLTVLLWILGGLHGMNSTVVAMIPVGVFVCTGIVTKEDLKSISWDVLWLVSGGIALGLALEKTGLASRLVTTIPFASFSPFMVLLSATLLTLTMANFMSHTATANLLLPIMAALATALTGQDDFGGAVGLLLAVTFAASLGMSLPISTPPNALASATGMIETKDMAKVGVIMGLGGLAFTFGMLWVMQKVGFFLG